MIKKESRNAQRPFVVTLAYVQKSAELLNAHV